MTTTLTAAAQSQYGRVLLQLTFTTVTSASVVRVHADGTTWPVRNAEPAAVMSSSGVGWVGYDHEAPLDQAVSYKATSTQDATVITSSSVTLASGNRVWLTHPLKPSLGGSFLVRDAGDIAYDGRGATLPIVGSRLPVAMTEAELAGTGSLILQTTTAAQASTVKALTADGAVLMLRYPASWDVEPWLYIRRLVVSPARYVDIGSRPERRWTIQYHQVARPAGTSQGAVGSTYADAKTAYATYALLKAGEATYSALATKAGP